MIKTRARNFGALVVGLARNWRCGGGDDATEEPAEEAAAEEPAEEAAAETAGDEVLRLGSLLPETGNLAFLGPPEFAGVELAVAEIAAGGINGAASVASR